MKKVIKVKKVMKKHIKKTKTTVTYVRKISPYLNKDGFLSTDTNGAPYTSLGEPVEVSRSTSVSESSETKVETSIFEEEINKFKASTSVLNDITVKSFNNSIANLKGLSNSIMNNVNNMVQYDERRNITPRQYEKVEEDLFKFKIELSKMGFNDTLKSFESLSDDYSLYKNGKVESSLRNNSFYNKGLPTDFQSRSSLPGTVENNVITKMNKLIDKNIKEKLTNQVDSLKSKLSTKPKKIPFIDRLEENIFNDFHNNLGYKVDRIYNDVRSIANTLHRRF